MADSSGRNTLLLWRDTLSYHLGENVRKQSDDHPRSELNRVRSGAAPPSWTIEKGDRATERAIRHPIFLAFEFCDSQFYEGWVV